MSLIIPELSTFSMWLTILNLAFPNSRKTYNICLNLTITFEVTIISWFKRRHYISIKPDKRIEHFCRILSKDFINQILLLLSLLNLEIHLFHLDLLLLASLLLHEFLLSTCQLLLRCLFIVLGLHG